jgi:UDP-N-acetylglucosamine 2-epimerase (non-hydrolysing)
LTLRANTERPITLEEHGGASQLVGSDVQQIRKGYQAALQQARKPVRPPLWDGHAAERILQALLDTDAARP